MSSAVPPALLDFLFKIVSHYPDGASLDDVCRAMDPRPKDRTASSWLAVLEATKRIEKIGAGPATRYKAIQTAVESTPFVHAADSSTVPATAPITDPDRLSALSPADSAPSASDADPTAVRDAILAGIVGSGMVRPAALYVLQQQGAAQGLAGSELTAYIDQAEERLNTLTAEQANALGINAARYGYWRRNFLGVFEISRPQAPTASAPSTPLNPVRASTEPPPSVSAKSAAAPQVKPTPQTMAENRAPRERAVPVVPSVDPASVHLSAAVARVVPGVATVAELADVLAPLGVLELAQEGKQRIKTLMTWGHAVLALGWGLVVYVGAQWLALKLAPLLTAGPTQLVLLALQLVGLAAIPASGLPWFIFVQRAQLKAQRAGEPQRPMTSAALGAVVVLGGLLTFIATKVLLTVLSWF